MSVRMKTAALSAAISLAGCSTTATIHRVNGPAYEAPILQSDPTSLEVEGDDGRPYRVPRDQVSEIDHPGNVLATVGAVLLALGGLTAWSVATDPSQSDRKDTAIAVSLVYGLPGLLMAVTGGAIWLSSKSKARPFEDALTPIPRMLFERPQYPPRWSAPPWPPAAPAPPGSKPPIQLEAEPMPPQAAPPTPPPAPEPAPAPQ